MKAFLLSKTLRRHAKIASLVGTVAVAICSLIHSVRKLYLIDTSDTDANVM